MRPIVIAALAPEPRAATGVGSAYWMDLTPDERAIIALGAAQDAASAALLMDRIGVTGWNSAPPDARTALLQAVNDDPLALARGGGALWQALDADARPRVALDAAQDAASAAVLMERIGADGWRLAPDAARQTLLAAVAGNCWSASYGGFSVWIALDDAERIVIVRDFYPPPRRCESPCAIELERQGGDRRADAAADLPAASDDAEVRHAWRAALRALEPASLRHALARMPQTVAVALAPRRRALPGMP